MNDSISRDPKLIAEARAAANAQPAPALPFDPKTVFCDEFLKHSDKRFPESPEEAWSVITEEDGHVGTLPILSALTEREFRELIRSFTHLSNALAAKKVSESELKRHSAVRELVMQDILARTGKDDCARTHITTGTLRAHDCGHPQHSKGGNPAGAPSIVGINVGELLSKLFKL